MPDYEIDNLKKEVGVTIYGKMLDERYTRVLKERSDLTMRECIMLDAVQKGHLLTDEARRYLKGKKLIEGKAPNLSILLRVAQYIKDTLPSMRTDEQKGRLLSNILSEMKQDGLVDTNGRHWLAR